LCAATSATVTQCGRVCYRGQKVNLSQALAGQLVGVETPMSPEWTAGNWR
jgi:hypothetical protein